MLIPITMAVPVCSIDPTLFLFRGPNKIKINALFKIKELPKISVARLPTGVLALIDGFNILESARLQGAKELIADVYDIPRHHWTLYALTINLVHTETIEKKDIDHLIWRIHSIDGIENAEIIRMTKLTPNFVKLLIAKQDAIEKEYQNRRILKLHESGVPVALIADILRTSIVSVYRRINDEEKRKSEAGFTEADLPVVVDKALLFLEKTGISNLFQIHDDFHCKTLARSCKIAKNDLKKFLKTSDPVDNILNPIFIADKKDFPESILSAITDFVLDRPMTDTEFAIIFCFLQIQQGISIQEISSQHSLSKQWLLNISFSLLAIYQGDESLLDIASLLNIPSEQIQLISDIVNFLPNLFPDRQKIFEYLEADENMAPYANLKHNLFSRREKLYIYCIENGLPPRKYNEVAQPIVGASLSPEILKIWEGARLFLNQFDKQISDKAVLDNDASAILQQINLITLLLNSISKKLQHHL